MTDYNLKNLANKILNETKLDCNSPNPYIARIRTAINTLSEKANISHDEARRIFIEIKPHLSDYI